MGQRGPIQPDPVDSVVSTNFLATIRIGLEMDLSSQVLLLVLALVLVFVPSRCRTLLLAHYRSLQLPRKDALALLRQPPKIKL